MLKILRRLKLIGICPVSHEALVILGYKKHPIGYYCAPSPAHGGTYRLEFKATHFESKGDGKGLLPIKGTEELRAFVPIGDECTIRRFKTISELNYFHKGMCGAYLY